jgi:hypothetical protein
MSLRARFNPLPALLALVSSLLIACVLLAGGPEAVLAALPLICIATALAFNRYPGERLLHRLARRGRRRRRPILRIAPRRRADALYGLTLLLLAATRPLRGPPLLSSHSI